jgi:hypothetical protein
VETVLIDTCYLNRARARAIQGGTRMGVIVSKKTIGLEPVVVPEKKVVRQWQPARKFSKRVLQREAARRAFFSKFFAPK